MSPPCGSRDLLSAAPAVCITLARRRDLSERAYGRRKEEVETRTRKEGQEGADGEAAATVAATDESTDSSAASDESTDSSAASDESTDSSAASRVDTLTAEPARRGALTEMVPVRFDTQMLADVRARAASDHRSVSSWIRHAVDLELRTRSLITTNQRHRLEILNRR